jgi:hypothetical protein
MPHELTLRRSGIRAVNVPMTPEFWVNSATSDSEAQHQKSHSRPLADRETTR